MNRWTNWPKEELETASDEGGLLNLSKKESFQQVVLGKLGSLKINI